MTARDRAFMKVALEEAYRGISRGAGGPFGAVIVRGSEILARGHNEVLRTHDPTRHAEICAIRRAAKKLETPHFKGAVIYSTTEPCVMCFAAINWAQMGRIFFGTSVRDVKRLGFNELVISNQRLNTLGGGTIKLVRGFMRSECLELLRAWRALPERATY